MFGLHMSGIVNYNWEVGGAVNRVNVHTNFLFSKI